jgi:hypothetical protein
MANTPAPNRPVTKSAEPGAPGDDDTPNSSGPEAAPLAVGMNNASAGLAGRRDFEKLNHDTDPGLTGKDLLAAAQVRAPNLTAEFVSAFDISDEHLRGIATGAVPPPPAVGPVHSTDLYLTPGGWVNVPAGVDPSRTLDGTAHVL